MSHATVTLTFSTPINISAQVGDIGYYVEVNSNVIDNIDFDSNHTVPNTAPIQEIGPITEIEVINVAQTDITFEIHNWGNIPGGVNLVQQLTVDLGKWFIMFAKDNSVNLSNILGYYAKARFINNSPERAELFSVGAEAQLSSK